MTDSGITNKWKGILTTSLHKVQKQVQPTLTVDNEALIYLEELIIQLLVQLCNSQPHSISDIEERIEKTFPVQIKDWAISSAQDTIAKKKKKTLTLSVDKLQSIINKEVLGYKIDQMSAMYLVAVLEYISADILKLAGNYVKNIRHSEITAQDVKVAMGADKVLMSMFSNEEIEIMEPILKPLSNRGSLMYIEVLKDFRIAEEQYLRELNLIIKLFQEPMVHAKDVFSNEDIEEIFSNIKDIYELTVQFCSMIETAFEMANDNSGSEPLLGYYIEDLAVSAEFGYYEIYALDQVEDIDENPDDLLKLGTYGKIRELLKKPDVKEFFQKKGIYLSVKYILPKLLYEPLYHCQDYFEYIRSLMWTSPDGEDRENLDASLTVLRPLQSTIETVHQCPSLKRSPEVKMFYQRRMGTAVPNATAKILSIQANMEGWEGKDLCQIASLFLKEGTLLKASQDGKKPSERKVFLFDNLMLCTKPNSRYITGFSQAEYRLKERINLRKAEVIDLEDTPGFENCFEVSERNICAVVLCCKDDETKYEWLSYLMTLQCRSTLDRMLDVILQEEDQSVQLQYPDPSEYIFSEEDAEDNIVFEDTSEDDCDVPIIRGGTLYKLVERLTYHKYADPNFVRVFLTTYRSFSNPVELLDLLIKRYDIPDPIWYEKDGSSQKVIERKFRKEYIQPIHLRVLNVLRHWVDQHFYDFQREESLLTTLEKFLSKVNRSKTAKKWVDTIEKIVNRRLEVASTPEVFTFNIAAPSIEWHLATTLDKFSLLMLHPLEIGRQLTLLHSEIFRAIKPSELVGSAHMKKDKEKLAPDTLRMIHFSTRLTFWYEVNICETLNFEERVAVYSRIIDILMVFMELNNFNGMMELLAALHSAPVHRLHFTTGELSPKRQQVLQEVRALTEDGHNVKYTEKLRSINPPCVPFLGTYLTNILKAEEGNPDFLAQNSKLINFSKRRMVAEITGEIQKYQDTPYNLQMQPLIREYLESLDPQAGRTVNEMNEYLFELSLKVEPRHAKQPAKFPRTTDMSLRSPGIKPSGKSQPSSRRSSSQLIEPERSPPVSNRLRPPSPSPSTASSFSTFTINEDDEEKDDEKAENKESVRVSPPPALLPRAPTIDESPPDIPEKPLIYQKQLSNLSISSDRDEQPLHDSALSGPPLLPPRTPLTPKTFSLFPITCDIPVDDCDTPPLPKRSASVDFVSRRHTETIPPPLLPPRNAKPILKQKSLSEIATQPLPELSAPPKIPPRRSLPR